MLLIYMLLVLHSVLAKEKIYYDIEEAEEYFQLFIKTHNKSYTTFEWDFRYNIFKENLLHINEMNRIDPHSTFGINQFCDLTTEEFLMKHTGFRSELFDNTCKTIHVSSNGDVPQAFDWRDHIPIQVKDQQTCGSCWAFAATGQMETLYAIRKQQTLSLSEQQLIDCDNFSKGCNGGKPSLAFRYLMQCGGQASEAVYPYANTVLECQFMPEEIVADLSDCFNFQLSTEDSLREVIFKYGPVTAALDATSLRTWHGGILSQCVNQNINHAVMIVGYGTDPDVGKDYWVIKNSWGTQWGENGFIRIERGVNSCGIINQDICAAVL